MKLKGTRQYKIGIAKNPKWRKKDIDEAVKGEVRIIMKRQTFFAESKEKKMHRIFKDVRFTKRGAGSGKTEWFRFNFIEAFIAKCWLYWYAHRFYIVVCAFGLLAVILELIKEYSK